MERALNGAGKPMNGSRLLILGVAYKGGTGDVRESPALEIISLCRELGAAIAYHDPHVPELSEFGMRSAALDDELRRADLVTIVTAHPDVDYERIVRDAALVLDFRGVTRKLDATNVVRL
jgi:UDP-N-acetyl-D-mannosaminuronate dehydrogenase